MSMEMYEALFTLGYLSLIALMLSGVAYGLLKIISPQLFGKEAKNDQNGND